MRHKISFADPSFPIEGANHAARPGWLGFAMPMADKPGTQFDYYRPGTSFWRARSARQRKKSLADYAQDKLFGPLGIARPTWPADPSGVNHGYADLKLMSRDLSK